jgi:adenylyltransferase/sulfurtransferase
MFKLFNREPEGFDDLSPQDVHERMTSGGRVQLIDVRSPGEFARGHIPKARLIPLGELEARHAELRDGSDIILYCHTAARSRRGARLLARLGHENVYNMAGGLVRWPYGVKQ